MFEFIFPDLCVFRLYLSIIYVYRLHQTHGNVSTLSVFRASVFLVHPKAHDVCGRIALKLLFKDFLGGGFTFLNFHSIYVFFQTG